MVNQEDLLDANALCDQILRTSRDSIAEVSGLYIDDKFEGAVESREELDALLNGILGSYRSGSENERAEFIQDVQVVDGLYPISSIVSVEEMEEYLDFEVPVLDKEAASYAVFIEDRYPTMGQIEYADGSEFRMQYGSGDISGIHGGTLEKSEKIDGGKVEQYRYDNTTYAIWEQNGFTFSYVYTDSENTDVASIIQQFA